MSPTRPAQSTDSIVVFIASATARFSVGARTDTSIEISNPVEASSEYVGGAVVAGPRAATVVAATVVAAAVLTAVVVTASVVAAAIVAA